MSQSVRRVGVLGVLGGAVMLPRCGFGVFLEKSEGVNKEVISLR